MNEYWYVFFLNVENCKILIDMNIKVANAWCSKLSIRLLFIIGRYSHNGLKLVKKSILTNFYPQWAVYVCMYVCLLTVILQIQKAVLTGELVGFPYFRKNNLSQKMKRKNVLAIKVFGSAKEEKNSDWVKKESQSLWSIKFNSQHFSVTGY